MKWALLTHHQLLIILSVFYLHAFVDPISTPWHQYSWCTGWWFLDKILFNTLSTQFRRVNMSVFWIIGQCFWIALLSFYLDVPLCVKYNDKIIYVAPNFGSHIYNKFQKIVCIRPMFAYFCMTILGVQVAWWFGTLTDISGFRSES